ncbi:sensor histidine kinase KdpD [Bacteroides sp. 51]|uniref:sensor histidine kinase n=1 Tax=Bacteroides sp. 51 TaxID=2302938 RepID=UPI0013D0E5D2|nr:HAMP domain-containing sensor histidine kinase [Bacteroides sp. 51]NDV80669.1 sensor histidine kinase [Bacteroides sp. 51]
MEESEIITRLIKMVDEISSGNKPAKISKDEMKASDNPLLNELSDKLCKLNNQYSDSYQFILDLSRGKLNTETPERNPFINPYKQLQSELRYLTWQIQQIGDGVYDQRVFFSGEFSYAINKMVLALRERQALTAKLEESNQTKNKLLSIIAHDLRNPFNVVMEFSEMLMHAVDSRDDKKIKECAEMINSSSFRIYDLLMNLLEWSRLQDGIVVSPEEINLKSILLGAVRMAHSAAYLKDITIHFDDSTDYPIRTDTSMLNAILRNLLDNAIKYTPEHGRVAISIRKDHRSYYISVQDNGVGMSEKVIHDVFDLGTAHSSLGTNNESGTGIGLILSCEFARLLKGEITAESKLRGGTTVTLSLPMRI